VLLKLTVSANGDWSGRVVSPASSRPALTAFRVVELSGGEWELFASWWGEGSSAAAVTFTRERVVACTRYQRRGESPGRPLFLGDTDGAARAARGRSFWAR